jgi:hypothetical protein
MSITITISKFINLSYVWSAWVWGNNAIGWTEAFVSTGDSILGREPEDTGQTFFWDQNICLTTGFSKEFVSPGINCALLKLISKTKKGALLRDYDLVRTYVGRGPQYRWLWGLQPLVRPGLPLRTRCQQWLTSLSASMGGRWKQHRDMSIELLTTTTTFLVILKLMLLPQCASYCC